MNSSDARAAYAVDRRSSPAPASPPDPRATRPAGVPSPKPTTRTGFRWT
jgi:hypothetical protein